MFAPAKSRTAEGAGPAARGRVSRVVIATLLGLALSGCFLFDTDEKYVTAKEDPADLLFNQALTALNSRQYSTAVEKFSEVDRQHPFSEWSKRSILLSAYASFEASDYDSCIQAGKRYLSLYPGHKDAAYAQYLIASAYYKQIPDITRDQERAERAMQAFQDLLNRWPDSEYAADARFKMQVARDQMAAKEMEVGRYYLDRRNYIAAVNRFKAVVQKYQQTRHVEEALMRLAESYMAMGLTGEAQTAAVILGHNYPDSQWYKDAYTLVSTNGAAPREDEGSWLSKLFRSRPS